ncbi:hypothetical protein CANARDRAFT_10129 [[Candida] arabinofermentans NRRL YB-2248]|uniref:Uncharacterized protein n=1 Tax=[Candida] arabinofermentans NRRL YB-2248 TaxID=983967 RepID=A0A1E4STL9_9ASCO|nr:hypothetical protein CANARDRAFT_10129 [[Candida] arabinofermentans NRRL YB-2248]
MSFIPLNPFDDSNTLSREQSRLTTDIDDSTWNQLDNDNDNDNDSFPSLQQSTNIRYLNYSLDSIEINLKKLSSLITLLQKYCQSIKVSNLKENDFKFNECLKLINSLNLEFEIIDKDVKLLNHQSNLLNSTISGLINQFQIQITNYLYILKLYKLQLSTQSIELISNSMNFKKQLECEEFFYSFDETTYQKLLNSNIDIDFKNGLILINELIIRYNLQDDIIDKVSQIQMNLKSNDIVKSTRTSIISNNTYRSNSFQQQSNKYRSNWNWNWNISINRLNKLSKKTKIILISIISIVIIIGIVIGIVDKFKLQKTNKMNKDVYKWIITVNSELETILDLN